MDLKKYYNEVLLRITQIDFSLLWPHFPKYNFALYDDNYVIYNGNIINKTNEFIGNTSIKYNNEYLAIWSLTKEVDFDILTSKIIHEMFHAFQNEKDENRFPNEFYAILNYNYQYDNLQIKYQENILLTKMLNDFNDDMFKSFLQSRKYRKTNFIFEYDYESKIEVIEGTAQFVELMALKQLNIDKYNAQLDFILKSIVDVNRMIPIRSISYDIGSILLIVLEENKIIFNKEIANNLITYSDYLIDNINYQEIMIMNNELLNKRISEDHKHLEESINQITKEKPVVKKDLELRGFNVFDARFHKGYLFSKHFIIYMSQKEEAILYGDFLIELKDLHINKIYKIK